MSPEEAARVLQSGEYSRRRGYLSNIINTWDQIAVTGTIAIWALLLPWNALQQAQPSFDLFTTQFAWASALASLLLGVWRYYARILDDSIIRLYPVLYLCERVLVPAQACTLVPPGSLPALTQTQAAGHVEWRKVRNSDFGGRWHHPIDWLAGFIIVAFGAISVWVAVHFGTATISWGGSFNLTGWLLGGNVIGILLVIGGWLWWKDRAHDWPVPPTDPKE